MTSSPPQVSIGRPTPKPIEFTRIVNLPPTRVVMSVDGLSKEGKTNFSLTSPAPVCVHNLDLGLHGTAEKFVDKELYQFTYSIPMSASLPGSGLTSLGEPARKVWEEFVTQFRASLEKMRTVVVDTGSEAWNLCRLARLGKLTQVIPIQYTAVNAEFRQLVQLALAQTKCNVIFTHKMKDEYKGDQKTGRLERVGFGEIGYDVETVVRTSRDYTKAGVDQFQLEIESCRANLEATGKRLSGTDCTFSKVATLIYPDTTEDFWK